MRRSMLTAVMMVGTLIPAAPVPATEDVFTAYQSASGSDTRDGLTPAASARSLVRLQQVQHGPDHER